SRFFRIFTIPKNFIPSRCRSAFPRMLSRYAFGFEPAGSPGNISPPYRPSSYCGITPGVVFRIFEKNDPTSIGLRSDQLPHTLPPTFMKLFTFVSAFKRQVYGL